MEWGSDPENFQITTGYVRIRHINRALMEAWFREISLVDIDTLPDEGGILFTTWHPGGLIDPMLMMAALPGNLTFAAKHTLFKVPILGRIIRMAGAKPVHRAQDSSEGDGGNRSAKNSNLIESLGDAVAMGGRVAIFPEGVSHLEAHPVRLRTGAARILLHAIRKANAEGKARPNVVPLGLHYTDQHRFRERVSLQVNNPLPIPPYPVKMEHRLQRKQKLLSSVSRPTIELGVVQSLNFSNLKWIVATKHRKLGKIANSFGARDEWYTCIVPIKVKPHPDRCRMSRLFWAHVEFALLGSSNPNMSLNSLNGLKVDFVNTMVK